jgi:uncharacterized protein (TIGR02145 family)
MRGLIQITTILAAVLFLAGCSKKPGQESVSETPDTSAVTYGTLIDERDGKKYKTVVIDGERWMAENLNYEIPGSSWCYNNDDLNCLKYGRLYRKDAAIKACPDGWYLPFREDWNSLELAADGSKVTAKMLRAKKGWNADTVNNASGNGTDDYGFSALPGGLRTDSHGYEYIGDLGYWWMVKYWWIDNKSGRLSMHYISSPSAKWSGEKGDDGSSDYSYKYAVSVRCIQDSDGGNLPDSVLLKKKEEKKKRKEERRIENLSSYFTDSRDGQRYRSVAIGGKTWMAQNLNYKTPDSSWCYENSADSCAKYGRLYAWNAATAACPDGWRLPSRRDLRELVDSAGYLKAANGWIYDYPRRYDDEDKDLHGFSAVPGGGHYSGDNEFYNVGKEGDLWSSTERGIGRSAYFLRLLNNDEGSNNKSAGYSVRCVQNDSASAKEKSDEEKLEEAGHLAKKSIRYFTDARDGRKYRSVKIGDDTWMAQNLNYLPPTGNSWCYENKDSYCDKYGRLYDLTTALRACPSGWHLPTRDEWDILAETAGGDLGRTYRNRDDTMDWLEAGLRLKSKTGWKDDDIDSATDNFGFSALPGGYRDLEGYFNKVGERGYWWDIKADEYWDYYIVEMDRNSDMTSEQQPESGARDGYSVRCVMNGSGEAEENRKKVYKQIEAELKKIDAENKKAEQHIKRVSTYFTDSRDEHEYRAVTIGGRVWMAENLNYMPPTGQSWCYRDCRKYGRLYDWNTARTVCPPGWHLPSNAEWNGLLKATGKSVDNAGEVLKSRRGWDDSGIGGGGDGTDDYGFSALPGGYRQNGFDDHIFGASGGEGRWWTSTRYIHNEYTEDDSAKNAAAKAFGRSMGHDHDGMYGDNYDKRFGFSVRCVQDNK